MSVGPKQTQDVWKVNDFHGISCMFVGLERDSTIELVMEAFGRSYVLGSPVKLDDEVQRVVSTVMTQTSNLPSRQFTMRNVEGRVRYNSCWDILITQF